jgi:hypothetical protein
MPAKAAEGKDPNYACCPPQDSSLCPVFGPVFGPVVKPIQLENADNRPSSYDRIKVIVSGSYDLLLIHLGYWYTDIYFSRFGKKIFQICRR